MLIEVAPWAIARMRTSDARWGFQIGALSTAALLLCLFVVVRIFS